MLTLLLTHGSLWNLNDSRPEKVVRFMLALLDASQIQASDKARKWLTIMANESEAYLSSMETERVAFDRFFHLGEDSAEYFFSNAEQLTHC